MRKKFCKKNQGFSYTVKKIKNYTFTQILREIISANWKFSSGKFSARKKNIYILVLCINHYMKKNKICIEPQNLKKLFFQLQISVFCTFIRENDAKNEKCGKIFNDILKNYI